MATENTISPLRDIDGKILPGGFVYEYLERDPKLEDEIKLIVAKEQNVAQARKTTSKEKGETQS